MEEYAIGVLGPVSADELGSVLPHERLIFDLRARCGLCSDGNLRDAPIELRRLSAVRSNPRSNLENLSSPSEEVLLEELRIFRQCIYDRRGTIVDVTLPHEGRDPAALARLAEHSRVNIVMATGVDPSAVARLSADAEEREAQAEELICRVVAELTTGAVRAGCITGLELGALCVDDALNIVVAAHLRTSAPLICRCLPISDTAPHDTALVLLRRLASRGVNMKRVIVICAQYLITWKMSSRPLPIPHDSVLGILELGVTLCFDGLGDTWSDDAFQSICRERGYHSEHVVSEICACLDANGYSGQIVLSYGVCTRLQLCEYGGGGLQYIHSNFVQRGSARNSQNAAAARLLCWWRRPPPPARLMRPWECSACHRTFEEAVNQSDALPTDQHYYEKYDFRYCTTGCLSAHRSSGFAQPFTTPPPAG